MRKQINSQIRGPWAYFCCNMQLKKCLFQFVHSSNRSFIRPFIRPSIRSSIRLFVHSFVRLSVCSSIRSFVHPFIRPSVLSSIRSFVHPFFRPSVRLYICLFAQPFARRSVGRPSDHLSVCDLFSKSAQGCLKIVKDGHWRVRGSRMFKVSQAWQRMVNNCHGWSRVVKDTKDGPIMHQECFKCVSTVFWQRPCLSSR